MRCQACNKRLNTEESVYKNPETGTFEDMCFKCLKAIGIVPKGEVDENDFDDTIT